MGLRKETTERNVPDSAGLYWYRSSPASDWRGVVVEPGQGTGWGLTVTENTHTRSVTEMKGEWREYTDQKPDDGIDSDLIYEAVRLTLQNHDKFCSMSDVHEFVMGELRKNNS